MLQELMELYEALRSRNPERADIKCYKACIEFNWSDWKTNL